MNIFNKNNLSWVFFLMGPTASGKSNLAIELSQILPIELISVDSALIYKGMDIGTDKPSKKELDKAPHRLLNILDPSQIYSAGNFRNDALKEINKIIKLGRIPFLVGGTMLYFKVLLNGLSPLPSADLKIRKKIKQKAEKYGWNILHKQLAKIDSISAKRIHPNDLQRISRALEVFFISGKTLTELIKISGNPFPYQVYQFAIQPKNRIQLHQRIEQRFYRMLASGLEEEVRELFSRKDLNTNMPSIRCVKYRQMWSYLEDKISYEEMIYQSIHATRQLAKRQITWLRKWTNIHWLDGEEPRQALQEIYRVVNSIKNISFRIKVIS